MPGAKRPAWDQIDHDDEVLCEEVALANREPLAHAFVDAERAARRR